MRYLWVLLFLLLPSTAFATCSSVPFTFIPGTVAASGQVNSNFSSVVSCVNNIDGSQITTTITGTGSVVKASGPTLINPIFNGTVSGVLIPSAASNAALSTFTTVTNSLVQRTGFTTAGDSPPLTYKASGGACSLNAGSGDGGSQVPSADGKCWLAVFPPGSLDVRWWGTAADGTTDDSCAIKAAMIAAEAKILSLGPYRYRVGSACTLEVPPAETIKGPYANMGTVVPDHSGSLPYNIFPALLIDSGVTIKLDSSAAIDGLLVYRNGMTFPAADSSAFAGTPFTVNGDYITIENSLIMGFAQAVTSTSFNHGTINRVQFDNQANIYINNSTDTWHVDNIHAWPFATDSGPTPPTSALQRTGANFKITGSNDATMISHYLSLGYMKGFVFDNNQGATCTDCDADNTAAQAGSHGFEFTGTTAFSATTLLGPKSFSNDIGIYRSDTGGAGSTVKIIGATIKGNQVAGIELDGTTGLTQLYSSEVSQNIAGIIENSAASILDMDGNVMLGNGGTYPIATFASTDNIIIGPMNRFGLNADVGVSAAGPNVVIHQITGSGTTIPLPPVGRFFAVPTGGSYTDMTGGWAGREVTLFFGGTTTLQNNAGAAATKFTLHGGVNFTSPVVGSGTITLLYTGNANWFETARQ